MKKLLYITHLSGSRVNRFWLTSIAAAHELGYEFHLACNMNGAEQPEFDEGCRQYGIITHHIDFNRNPLSGENKKAYKELLDLLKREHFDIVHCNTPVGGLLGRLCSHKAHIPYVIYQAHGFHFWKGAPKKNWMFYYPVEKYLSKYTDALLTINKEDFAASQKFKAKRNYFIHGVGIDTISFRHDDAVRLQKRNELGLMQDDIALLSVGELIPRKNHRLVIDAIAGLRNERCFDKLQYYICGTGDLMEELTDYVKSLELEKHIHFLGFRVDVAEIYNAMDIFVFMSLQEGLPVALMEAMASGLPVICSNIRGNTDLVNNMENGILSPIDVKILKKNILTLATNKNLQRKLGRTAVNTINDYDSNIVVNELEDVYRRV